MNAWHGIPLGRLPFFRQQAVNDCGLACLRMVAAYYGLAYHPPLAERRALFTPRGISILTLCAEAEAIGLRCTTLRGSFAEFLALAVFPCILYWQGRHFVVAVGHGANVVGIVDPSCGERLVDYQSFCANWPSIDDGDGIVLQVSRA